MKIENKRLGLIAAVIVLPVVGYLIMRAIPESYNDDGTATGLHIITYLVLIAVGLTVPFLMLKSSMKSAKMGDSRERELHLKDIPKDKEQIARKS